MTTTSAPDRFAAGFTREAVEALSRLKEEPAWLRERRLAAFETYQQLPLPTREQRPWKYTDVSRLNLDVFTPYAPPADVPFGIPLLERDLRAGVLRQRDSAPGVLDDLADELREQGVIFCSLDEAVRTHPQIVEAHLMTECVRPETDKFTALHAAFWSGGIFLYAPRNATIRLPLYALLWAATPGLAIFPHALIVAEPGSQVTLIEEYGSPDTAEGIISLGVTEIFARDGATVRYINLQRWGATVRHFGQQRALLDRDASLSYTTIGLGGALAKSTGESIMRGPGANSLLLGLFFGRDHQQFDYVTLQEHLAPRTTSDLLFKSALNDQARSIYYGLVRIGPEAAEADANQENRNLLLSNGARADSDPVLEILTAEVARCSHGASVGPVDEEQLFYLGTRGIPRREAEELLVQGFFHEVIARVPVPEAHERLEQAIDERVVI
jgi:Fe-S cluster assembly protein SufD